MSIILYHSRASSATEGFSTGGSFHGRSLFSCLDDFIPHRWIWCLFLFGGIQRVLEGILIIGPYSCKAELQLSRIILACLGILDLATVEQFFNGGAIVLDLSPSTVIGKESSSAVTEDRRDVFLL